MRLMGGYYRALQGGRGLTQTDDCPPAGTVAAWTDNDQRSRETGAALLLGMYPRCANVAPRSQADLATPDPLFHPRPTASCPMDATATAPPCWPASAATSARCCANMRRSFP